jgi:hypothetical protein
MRRSPLLLLALLPAACGDSSSSSWSYPSKDAGPDAVAEAGSDTRDEAATDGAAPDAAGDVVQDSEPDAPVVTSCNFGYESLFVYGGVAPLPKPGAQNAIPTQEPSSIAHHEPPPPFTYRLGGWRDVDPEDLVMPGYSDDMPLFERAGDWTEGTRCFETPTGVKMLSEAEAYDLYRTIAERTTGVAMKQTREVRTVVGLRGSYPGQIAWHGNKPNRFNDTLVLLWITQDDAKHVREFPVNTDTGAHDFGYHSSSSLRPNRRYRYDNSWHNTYNALHVDETDYRVRDDANKNGHWDSDRNGWLPPAGADDHDRTGSGHNIHMGSVDGPLGSAAVDVWSAGCQVIPGIANWTAFITKAWTEMKAKVDYFLVDTRDIPSDVWTPCTPDGSRACPFRIESLPFSDTRDTAAAGEATFDTYSCSTADESGPEIVYELHVDTVATLKVSVECQAPVDIDVHLLDGDDPNACLARNDASFEYAITPGRYLVVADTFVEGGTALSGTYTLHVSLE